MLRKIKSITINLYVAQYEITQKTLPQILLTICPKNCNLGNIDAGCMVSGSHTPRWEAATHRSRGGKTVCVSGLSAEIGLDFKFLE